MTSRSRFIALALCACLLLALSASFLLVLHEAGHDCSGENCPVCRLVSSCIRSLRSLALSLLLAFFLPSLTQAGAFRQEPGPLCAPATPVQWKVRMND